MIIRNNTYIHFILIIANVSACKLIVTVVLTQRSVSTLVDIIKQREQQASLSAMINLAFYFAFTHAVECWCCLLPSLSLSLFVGLQALAATGMLSLLPCSVYHLPFNALMFICVRYLYCFVVVLFLMT